MSQTEEKKKLRKEMKERARGLSRDYCETASRRICDRVTADADYQQARVVFCFVGVGAEPDTRAILEDALRSRKRLCVPRCIDKTTMEAVEIHNCDEDLERGFYGLLEPKEGLASVPREEIEFGVIPCVSCDYDGNRLGHGRGYYDRYLEGMDFPCALICFEKMTCGSGVIPVDEHDRKIARVITDAE